MGALLNLLLLQIDREGLHLSEQEAREGVAGIRDPWQVAADGAEDERAGRPRWLVHVEPLPAGIEPHLQGVTAFEPGQRVGDFGELPNVEAGSPAARFAGSFPRTSQRVGNCARPEAEC